MAHVVLCALLLAGCNAADKPPSGRLAILAAENLGPDPSHAWLGQAFAAIVAEQLMGSSLDPQRVNSRGDIVPSRAMFVLHSWFDVQRDTVDLHATLEDRQSKRMIRDFRTSGPLSAGPLPLAASIAERLSDHTRSFGTGNLAAIRAYGEALETDISTDRDAALGRALQADPDFSEAVHARAALMVSRGDAQQARGYLDEAIRRRVGHDEVARARLRVLRASLESDPEPLIGALGDLAKLVPADSDAAERLALALLGRRRYAEAADWLLGAARTDPQRPTLWNERGYALAYAGKLDEAVQSLERYREAEPDSPNPLDSLGEIHFHLGRLSRAEKYFLETHRKAPDFQEGAALVKAARARLMLGDLDGADEHFARYLDLRRQAADPWVDLRSARWRFDTGRRAEAIQLLEEAVDRPEVRSEITVAARAQLAAWALLLGDVERARVHAAKAREAAGSGPVPAPVVLSGLLAQPAAPANVWRARAEEAFPGTTLGAARREALAWALLLSKHTSEAQPVLREILDVAPPFSGDEFRVLLSAALIDTGHRDQAGPLVATNPIIQPGAEPLLYPLIFPRILYLRGVLGEDAGNSKTAAENYRLFLQCSGDRPLFLGEEAKARQALARLGG